jgi:hypothetical protein
MNLPSLSASRTIALSSTSAREVWAERQEERWQNMQEGLRRLRAMPSPKETAKAHAASRVEQLKERIKQLRAMLIGLPPEQAKAILRQISTIAKELGGMAKVAGSDSGDGAVSLQVLPSGAAAATTGVTTASSPPSDESAVVEEKPDRAPATAAASEPAAQNAGNDKSLRDKLEEVAKQLKALLEQVKARMRKAHQREDDDLRAAENALHQVDAALKGGGDLYGGLGAAAGMAPTLTLGSVASSISVMA